MTARPLLLGHRGVRGSRYRLRENTVAAFDLALEYGCDGFEFDVRITADHCGVICHNQRSFGISISEAAASTLTDLPSLQQVIEGYAGRAFLDIELKVPGLESILLTAIALHPPIRGCVVSSFVPEVLLDLRTRNSSVPLGIICETERQLARWPELPVQYVITKQSLITQQLIHDVHSSGKEVFAWTVNQKRSMLRLATWGIDGIISDKVDLLVSTLRNPEP